MNEPHTGKQKSCFAQGCLALVILFVLTLVVGGAGGWWIYSKAVNSFSSDRPTNVVIDEPRPQALQQARSKLQQLQNAVRNRTDSTVVFSAADLNALIARDPSFSG